MAAAVQEGSSSSYIPQIPAPSDGLIRAIMDTGCFAAGGSAGVVGRSLILPLDMGGAKGPLVSVARAFPRQGLMMWMYVPASEKNQPDTLAPYKKMKKTFWNGFYAGVLSRALTNPVSAIGEACTPTRGYFESAKYLYTSKGFVGFFGQQPPVFTNGLHYGFSFVCFEGARRFIHNNTSVGDDLISDVAVNGVAATVGSTVACCASYPVSRFRYEAVVARESAVSRGLLPAILKEAPQFGIAMATFTLLMPFVAPHHANAGFGK